MSAADRELLELAAKAAGLVVTGTCTGRREIDWLELSDGSQWNAIQDDGDALRLAVELGIQITPGTYLDHKATAYSTTGTEAYEYVHSQQDMLAATRRAIVRAAAEIGKAMQ